MRSLRLRLQREELLRALATLSKIRRKRIGLVPVWLGFDAQEESLTIQEERGHASATVPASGNWPPTGATVDLAHLRGAADKVDGPTVELIMAPEAILIPRKTGYVRLGLLEFGKKQVSRESAARRIDPPDSLPLFQWARSRRSRDSDIN